MVGTIRSLRMEAILGSRDPLHSTARRGYAVDLEENELGAHCVAVAITDGAGGVRGAISLSGPAQRMPEDGLPRFGAALTRAAQVIMLALSAR